MKALRGARTSRRAAPTQGIQPWATKFPYPERLTRLAGWGANHLTDDGASFRSESDVRQTFNDAELRALREAGCTHIHLVNYIEDFYTSRTDPTLNGNYRNLKIALRACLDHGFAVVLACHTSHANSEQTWVDMLTDNASGFSLARMNTYFDNIYASLNAESWFSTALADRLFIGSFNELGSAGQLTYTAAQANVVQDNWYAKVRTTWGPAWTLMPMGYPYAACSTVPGMTVVRSDFNWIAQVHQYGSYSLESLSYPGRGYENLYDVVPWNCTRAQALATLAAATAAKLGYNGPIATTIDGQLDYLRTNYPGDNWLGDNNEDGWTLQMGPALAAARQYGFPIWVGEMGYEGVTVDGNHDPTYLGISEEKLCAFMGSQARALQALGIGYATWLYKTNVARGPYGARTLIPSRVRALSGLR